MAAAGEVLRQNFPGNLGACHGHGRGSPELHVLAVDDSLVDRKVIEKLLKSLSCKVTAVESARRALQFLGLEGEKSSVGFDALKVNLIMTDYSMPGMTGYELLKKIKGSSTFREIPVVIMSSETILGRINRCLEEGAEDFLEKPVKLSDVERLTRILTREPEDSDDDNKGDKSKIKRKLQTDDFNCSGEISLVVKTNCSDETLPAMMTICSGEISPVPSSLQPSSPLPDQSTSNFSKRVRR